MSRHADDSRKRGVAGWLIASGIGGVVLAIAIGSYFIWLRSDAGSGAVDTSCTGSSQVQVVAGAGAPAIRLVAEAYNRTRPASRGTCTTVQVSAVTSTMSADALLASWSTEGTPKPAVWVADSAADVAALQAASPELVAGHSDTPVAVSPVVLAAAVDDATQFPASFQWPELARAVRPNSGFVLPGGRQLSVTFGDPRTELASALALQSMIGAARTTPLTVDDVAAVRAELRSLSAIAGTSAPTGEVLDAVAGAQAEYTVVPALEATVALFNRFAEGAKLQAVYLAGPTAIATLLPIAVSADWVEAPQADGASAFIAYLKSDAGKQALVGAGWRVPDLATGSVEGEGIDRSRTVTPLPAADASVTRAIAAALGLSGEPAPVDTASPTTSRSGATTTATTSSPTTTSRTTTRQTTTSRTTTTRPPTSTAPRVTSSEAPPPVTPDVPTTSAVEPPTTSAAVPTT
jgi:Bacterial extracellular solute-binding protein